MQWFKHQSDARNSLKLRKVRRKYGADGYAIYWFCLEAIAYEINKDNLTFDLKEDAETIGFELSIQEKRVEEIMKYMIEVGLFESSNNVITCLKLAESIDKSMTNSPKMRAWLDRKSIPLLSSSVMTSTDNANTCAELEVEKNRKENNKKNTTGKPLVNFSRWIELVREAGEKPIPIDSPIFEYAQDAGIDPDYLRLAWVEFKARYTDDTKRYKDWRAVFSKSVRGNWFKLWWHDGEGYKLTTLGQQNMAAMKTRDKREES